MSHSYKKNSFTGFTTAKSEKKEKRIYNRIIRHTTKQILDNKELEDLNNFIEPKKDEIMDKWSMAKDGKQFIDRKSEWYNKAIRK